MDLDSAQRLPIVEAERPLQDILHQRAREMPVNERSAGHGDGKVQQFPRVKTVRTNRHGDGFPGLVFALVRHDRQRETGIGPVDGSAFPRENPAVPVGNQKVERALQKGVIGQPDLAVPADTAHESDIPAPERQQIVASGLRIREAETVRKALDIQRGTGGRRRGFLPHLPADGDPLGERRFRSGRHISGISPDISVSGRHVFRNVQIAEEGSLPAK